MTVGIFLFGFFVFSLYLVGLLTMLNKAHQQQTKELQNDPELKGFDWKEYDKKMLETPNKKRKSYKRKQKT